MNGLIVPNRWVVMATRIFGVALVMVALGCGGSNRPEMVRVSGSVSYKGSPLSGGVVTFSPTAPDHGRPAQARIDEQGQFVASTFDVGDGLVPGEYRISVVSTIKGTEPVERDRGTGIGGKSAIPVKYNDPKTSDLSVAVDSTAGVQEIDLELED